MKMEDFNELRSEFEALQKKEQEAACGPDGCDEPEESFDDYPDYVRAIYAEIMPPVKSGVLFSRWDIKGMAAELDEHIVVDVRERMFQHYMRFIVSREDMENVINEFKKHIDMKCGLYTEYSNKYPAVATIFNEKISKAEHAKKYLDKMLKDFF